MQWDDQKCDAFKITRGVVKTNQDVIDEQCIGNDDVVSAVSDEDMKLDYKSYHEKLLNTVFAWDESSLSHTDTVSNIPLLIDKGVAKKLISKIKNGKVAELSVVVSEMVKAVGEAGVGMYCGLTPNPPILSICTFCCPNIFLGVPRDWGRSLARFLI